MALVLLSEKSITRSGVRAVTLRQVLIAGSVCLSFFAFGGFCLGMFIGQNMSYSTTSPRIVLAQPLDPAREAFASRKLGDMAGRLVKLESDARALVKKLGAIELLEKRLDDLQHMKGVPSAKNFPGSVGGQELPPRSCVEEGGSSPDSNVKKLLSTERRITCLQELIGQMESATTFHRVAAMSLPTHFPIVNYRLGSTFGNRSDPFSGRLAFHSGLDFSADTGTPIHAAGGGRVSFSGMVSELGNVVEIDHGNGLRSRYAHCSRLSVKQGELVTPGQLVAEVGSTGRSTGPHLHFEVLKDGMFVDPMPYLNLNMQAAGV